MAADETGEDPHSTPDARLASLDERLKRAEQAELDRKPAPDAHSVVRNAGWRIAQNLIGMPVGGAIVGFLLDRLLGTMPWITLGLMFTGFAGAVLNMMKITNSSSTDGAGK